MSPAVAGADVLIRQVEGLARRLDDEAVGIQPRPGAVERVEGERDYALGRFLDALVQHPHGPAGFLSVHMDRDALACGIAGGDLQRSLLLVPLGFGD